MFFRGKPRKKIRPKRKETAVFPRKNQGKAKKNRPSVAMLQVTSMVESNALHEESGAGKSTAATVSALELNGKQPNNVIVFFLHTFLLASHARRSQCRPKSRPTTRYSV